MSWRWFLPDYLPDSASVEEVNRHDDRRILAMIGIFFCIPFVLGGLILIAAWLTTGVCT